MAPFRILLIVLILAPVALYADQEAYAPANIIPPAPQREFRGAWVTTVANLDWPSRPGLSVPEQKAELIELLDHAAHLHLNAVIFQVRPMADAVYASSLEPWSEFITGTMGRAPEPFYDPLAFAIGEAHKRGLELHAWFNPFRVSLPPNQARSPAAFNHISRSHPEWVRHYGELLWLDPGEPAARRHVLDVVLDVVRRYDVDGVTFDDYFYPYPEKDAEGRPMDFPDTGTWRRYGMRTGLSRDDWRRSNVNDFVQDVYHSIKALKPWVKFGISPFGIWRPGFPDPVQGLDAYSKIYADSRLWLANGWLDYLSPQLYWPVDSPQQGFPVLLKWWSEQNVRHRHLWPSLDAVNVGTKWSPNEMVRQIQVARGQAGVSGEIFYHLDNLIQNRTLAERVRGQYAQPALVPASFWLDSTSPDKPRLGVSGARDEVRIQWERSGGGPVWLWVLQFQVNGIWTTDILPGNQTSWTFQGSTPDVIAVRAVDRVENLSPPAALQKTTSVPVHPKEKFPGLNWRRTPGR